MHQPDLTLESSFEHRLPPPPALQICRATDLAPLRHALAQVDGASLFDSEGTLSAIGVRLIPSAHAEMTIAPFRGTRHTSARRYSADDPDATVIVVSEDGPVTVMRAGHLLGASALAALDASGDLLLTNEAIDDLSPEPACRRADQTRSYWLLVRLLAWSSRPATDCRRCQPRPGTSSIAVRSDA